MVEMWNGFIWPGVVIVAGIVALLVPLLLGVAYLTYVERKVIGAMQIRKGPNVVGPFGLLQPIADALKLAEEFADGGKVCVVLGDNIIEGSIAKAAGDFFTQRSGAKLLLKEVDDPHRFGVPQFDEQGSIAQIIEKPEDPPSSYAVIGIYFYDADVFEICRTLKPSGRGELEITDVNNEYIRRGDLTYSVLDGWWTDAGTFESLHHANCLVAKGGANHVEDEASTPLTAEK